jgi:hypothetical protein
VNFCYVSGNSILSVSLVNASRVTDWDYPVRGEVVDAGADSVPQQYPRYQVEPRGV